MILLDNIAFELQRAGGVSLVWRAILEQCFKDNDINLNLNLLNRKNDNIFCPDIPVHIPVLTEKTPLSIRRYLDIPKSMPAKVFHSSYFRVHGNKKVKNVVTVHDFVYEKYDQGLRKHIHLFQKMRALKAADAIICVSENTKMDLLDYHPWLSSREIRVIHNGVGQDFYPNSLAKSEMMTDYKVERPYLLYVGGRNSHKNFNAALMSLNLKAAKEINLGLRVVGGGPFTKSEFESINKLNLLNNVKYVGQVENSKLNQLYNEAFAFIYPSFYEGFGIPPLEAMAAGCPVICSNASSIPEVAGTAGLYFSPNEPESVENYLVLLQESTYRKKIIDMGLSRSAQFSWEKTGLETVKLYKEML